MNGDSPCEPSREELIALIAAQAAKKQGWNVIQAIAQEPANPDKFSPYGVICHNASRQTSWVVTRVQESA
jgi:hypothetical protein